VPIFTIERSGVYYSGIKEKPHRSEPVKTVSFNSLSHVWNGSTALVFSSSHKTCNWAKCLGSEDNQKMYVSPKGALHAVLPPSWHPSCRLCLPAIRNVKTTYFNVCNGDTILKSIEAQCLLYVSAVVSFIKCIFLTQFFIIWTFTINTYSVFSSRALFHWFCNEGECVLCEINKFVRI